jgi:hypothetical protein
VNEATAMLFDEFATAYRRGDSPDVLAYVERAGADADALADLIDRFLEAVPAREPTEEEIVLAHARLEHEPPLLALRVRRAITRETVIDALVSTLGLDPAKRTKVAGYYHRLETGTLDPEPVDARVWDVLSEALRANVRRLASFRPPPLATAEAAYLRRADQPQPAIDYLHTWAVEPPEPDEVDRLFTGSS